MKPRLSMTVETVGTTKRGKVMALLHRRHVTSC